MKQKETVVANALAATTAIIYIACRILVGLFPDLSFTIAQSWFHGIKLEQLNLWSLTWSSFILGLISSTIMAWAIGCLFASVYSFFAKK